MHSFLLILGLFTLSNISAAYGGPPRATTPQVDLGYEIHTGFLNVQEYLGSFYGALTNKDLDNWQLL